MAYKTFLCCMVISRVEDKFTRKDEVLVFG